MHPFNLILVRFSFVFVCRDLGVSRRQKHIVLGQRTLKLVVRRDQHDRDARRVNGRRGLLLDIWSID